MGAAGAGGGGAAHKGERGGAEEDLDEEVVKLLEYELPERRPLLLVQLIRPMLRHAGGRRVRFSAGEERVAAGSEEKKKERRVAGRRSQPQASVCGLEG